MNGIDKKSAAESHVVAIGEAMEQRSSKEKRGLSILVELNVLMTGRRCKRFIGESEALFFADMLFS